MNEQISLSVEDKMKLVTGQGTWHTNNLEGRVDSVWMSDGPHGLRAQAEKEKKNNKSYKATCFPTASALAASWDPELVGKAAGAIADEAKACGVSILLGPGVNMKRSPLCGRNFEYFSEDPFLAGKIAAAFIRAVEEKGIGTSLKHFAGNNQEQHRMRENSQIDERTLHEIYLQAFEIAVKEGKPATIMASYNRINGDYACMNKTLLTDILRKKWGFEGAVVSDWGACLNLARCVKAGMDIEMPGNAGIHLKKLKKSFEKGEITENELATAAERVLRLADKYGTGKAAPATDEECEKLLKSNYNKAVEIASECAVLLKNDGILPLGKKDGETSGGEKTKLTVIGDLASKPRIQGGGSSHINTVICPSFIDILHEKGTEFDFERGYDAGSNKPDGSLEDKAVALAEKSEGPVLFFGGLNDLTEGEGFDRPSLEMPDNQRKLLEKIEKLNKDIIFVSFSGSPYNLGPAEPARAILHMYLGGEGVSEAAYRLLFGGKNPCGKLAESFPMCIEDTPAYGNYSNGNDDICYREGLFTGYRYYDSFGKQVRFPFGYGLSYTTFEYSDLSTEASDNTDKIKIGFNITNTGSMPGKEIAQVYVKNPDGGILRPSRELRGFKKVELEPGETKHVEVELDSRAFSVYDVNIHDFRIVSGIYTIQVGSSLNAIKLEESGEIKTEFNQEFYNNYASSEPHIMSEDEFANVYGKPLGNFSEIKPGGFDLSDSIVRLSKYSVRARILKRLAGWGLSLFFLGRNKLDPEIRMIMETVLDGPLDTLVCQSGGILSMKFAEKIVAEANKKSLKKSGASEN